MSRAHSSRELLRRIALGLPIVALVPACAPDPCPPQHTTVTLDATTLRPRVGAGADARVIGGDAGTPLATAMEICLPLCRAYGSPGGLVAEPIAVDCSAATTGDDVVLSCTWSSGCVGRLPDAFVLDASRRDGDLGAWLARAARVEAASVLAFDDLADELARHDAPHALVRAATRSADDERAHARAMASLARAHGATAKRPVRADREPRDLLAIALDNAAEGLVRETYGAYLAVHQAARAKDASVARALAGIARDEARHALFSIALDDWARGKLSARHGRTLDEKRDAAAAGLRAALDAPTRDFHTLAGLPDADRAMDLAALVD